MVFFNGSTHTDADSIQISRAGIPAGLVSIPLRYMHSPVEMVDLRDVPLRLPDRADLRGELLESWQTAVVSGHDA